ncbi:MAG TPA: SH3 domain-containing protein [Anaerolineales bacterium]
MFKFILFLQNEWVGTIAAFVLLASISTGCSFGIRQEAIPSQTPLIITATFPATLTPQPSETPPPPSPQPMAPRATLVEGTTSTQINVRAEPSIASSVLGIIPANTKVEITGKDPGENWWQINYPEGSGGKGWVTAQYITTEDKSEIPAIGGNEADLNTGNVAIVQQQLNIRSGPGTDFNSLGTLNPQDVVNLTGKDSNGAWLQIDFPTGAGPEGKGWVNAAFVQAKGVENLPIITEAGLIVGTETQTGIPFTPTPTVMPAWADNDSPTNPIANVIFDPAGTYALIYNGDVSAPDGDAEDWIQFTPFSENILLEVSCKGSYVQIELIQMGQKLEPTSIHCRTQHVVRVQPSKPVQVHVSAIPDGTLNYSSYTLNIKTLP